MSGLVPSLTSDQIAQRIKVFDFLQYSDPNLLCGSNNKITLICINRHCKAPSLHCQNQKCTFCVPHIENNCLSFQLRSLTSLMKKKCQNLKYFVEQIIKIEITMLKHIESKRVQLVEKAKYNSLTKQEIFIAQNIFGKKKNMSKIKGFEIACMIQKLKNKNQVVKINDQIKVFKKKMAEISNEIIALQNKSINEITNPSHFYTNVDSLIMDQDPAGLRFILEQLNHPIELKLLYRASEHGFSSQSFHKECDNKPNTLTIIRTVHNKVIAGYTPLTWRSMNDRYKFDQDSETFVLSVTHRQKYQLNSLTNQAIYCSYKYGPVFGKQDFALLSGDPVNRTQILMNFPLSLNYNKSYDRRTRLIQKILGKDENKLVWVNEYEVYEVVKPQYYQYNKQKTLAQNLIQKQKQQQQQYYWQKYWKQQ